MIITYLDTETTGLNTNTAEICEIALIRCEYNNFELKKFEICSQLVKPKNKIPPEASAINHITNDMVKCSPNINDIKHDILKILDESIVCGHNIKYDLDVIKNQIGFIASKETSICSRRLANHAFKNLPSYSLQVLRYRFDLDSIIEKNNKNILNNDKYSSRMSAHRALFDTLLCKELTELCSKKLKLTNPYESKNICWKFIPQEKIKFGKYKGMEIDEVIKIDIGWIKWLMRQDFLKNDYPDLYMTLNKMNIF